MGLRLTNTLTRKLEDFQPIVTGKVSMYVCGVTVYDDVHLGHARSAVFYDVLRRWLECPDPEDPGHPGLKVTMVVNHTDVDDKIIARANEEDRDPLELSAHYIEKYFTDFDALGIHRADHYPKASEYIDEMIAAIADMVEKGYAYAVADNSVYFRVSKVEDYGKLSGQTLDAMRDMGRVEHDPNKEDPMDFALWKGAKPGEPSWESPWGPGRPGWHTECVVMGHKLLAETIDIHGGGSDLIFPHHEDELLQAEVLTGKPFVRYWVHNGMLETSAEKMSKSLGNFFTVQAVLEKHSMEDVRFYLLNSQYRKPLGFSWEALEEAAKSRARLQGSYERLRHYIDTVPSGEVTLELRRYQDQFTKAMNDDINTREAIGVLFELARDINGLMGAGTLNLASAQGLRVFLDEANDLLTILSPPVASAGPSITSDLIAMLLDVRTQARERKDFAQADRIRDQLRELGIEIQDSSGGPIWKQA